MVVKRCYGARPCRPLLDDEERDRDVRRIWCPFLPQFCLSDALLWVHRVKLGLEMGPTPAACPSVPEDDTATVTICLRTEPTQTHHGSLSSSGTLQLAVVCPVTLPQAVAECCASACHSVR